jgi:hypothetical protein
MFYSYQFSEEIPPLAVVYSQVLDTSQTEVAAMAEAPGLRNKSLSTATTQVGGHVSLIGKGLTRGSSNVAALARATFHLNPVALSAASSNVAAAVRRSLKAQVLAVGSSESWGLIRSTPYHTVVATFDAQVLGFVRAMSKSPQLTSPEAASVIKAVSTGTAYNATSGQSSSLLRTPGIGRMVANTQAVGIVRSLVRKFQAATASVVSRSLSQGKRLSVAAAEAVRVFRFQPLRLSVATTQVVSAAPGLKIFQRAMTVASGYSATVRRGLSARRGAASTSAAGVVYIPGRAPHVASPEAAGLVRTPGRVIGVASAGGAALRRLFGTQKLVAQAQQAAEFGPGLRRVVVGATSPEAASSANRIFRWRLLAVAQSGATVVAFHATVSLPKALSVAQVQVLSIARANRRSLGVAATMAVAYVRRISRGGTGVAAQSAVSARLTTGKPLSAGASAQSVAFATIRIVSSIRSAVSAQVVSLRPSLSRVRNVTSPSALAVRRGVNKQPRITTTQSFVVGKGMTRVYRVSVAQSSSVATPHGRILGTVLGQVVAIKTWFHLFVPAWLQQQTTLLPPAGGPAEPPSFSAVDPADQTTFAFDWSGRIGPNDPIVDASVVSIPSGLTYFGPPFVQGTLVQITVQPFSPLQLPVTYRLRCTVTTQSGRRSSFSIPLPVRRL